MRQQTIERAKDEFDILGELSARLSQKIREGYRSARPEVIRNIEQVELVNISDGLTKAFEEVAKRGYGRVVFADEYDENGDYAGATYYRVSQANAGFPDRPIRLVARNSPVGSQIASCSIGDEISVRVPKGERSILVTGIVDITGMSNLLRENPDAKRLLFRVGEGLTDEEVFNLRAFVRSLPGPARTPDTDEFGGEPVPGDPSTEVDESLSVGSHSEDGVVQAQPTPELDLLPSDEVSEDAQADPFWHIRRDAFFGDDAEVSLGSQFFTQTTANQEAGIQTVRGLQIVHGIAGSGKTSVALGRLKFFANFRSLENLLEYGLHERDFADFDASGMIGFVLSPSLVSYLKQTAESLDIGAMKIQDFAEFLHAERTHRRVFNGRPFKKSSEPCHPEQKSVRWLKILDIVAAAYVADGMREIAAAPLVKPAVPGAEKISDRRWEQLITDTWGKGPLRFRLQSLVRSLEVVAPDLDVRTFVLRKVAIEIDRRIRLGENESGGLEPSERRIVREAVENAQQRLFRLLNPQELYVRIFTEPAYRTRIEELALSVGISSKDVVDPIVERLNQNLVTDDDVICALCLNALSCDQFERDIRAIPYLRTFAERVGVFIDEYQDFNELQVLLMGYKALPKYWLVTVSGDASQRLHRDGLAEVQRAFPQIAMRHASVLLDRNMRQTGPLAALSACFRSLTEVDGGQMVGACNAPLDVYEDPAEFARMAIDRIVALPETASVAVICADDQDVDRWFALMHGDLDANFRNPMISDHSKLTMRFHTHFTTPVEAKGLEFDVVVIPNLAAYDGSDAVGRNSLYVAVSRPRHALLMGCDYEAIGSSMVAGMVDDGHLVLRTQELVGDPVDRVA
ncbi:hypothetical protein FJ420_21370 [Mesorhizobium sp. B3-1-3]|uniref:ATP-binding domain-containing protein n=1 Tax=unclassified Mesorhizobium TaxID=325217 RepID=UPI001127D359|nr:MULTISPECIES: ATP-binding domain-containing protein [unclassified Mesorhizobium]TPI59849.1 hypothetical protein FJ424_24705 [Mesorhizobium sp. B3-1-8]TPI68239.1 hypothetical protein FJ420_21370 [Mesorhizobium sp. B3-1-3]